MSIKFYSIHVTLTGSMTKHRKSTEAWQGQVAMCFAHAHSLVQLGSGRGQCNLQVYLADSFTDRDMDISMDISDLCAV